MDIKSPRTDNYCFTVDPSNDSDMERLKKLRESVKNDNLYRGHLPVRYVKCQGRMTPDHPNAKNWYGKGKRVQRFLALSEASRWDVYIYER